MKYFSLWKTLGKGIAPIIGVEGFNAVNAATTESDWLTNWPMHLAALVSAFGPIIVNLYKTRAMQRK